MRNTHGSFIWYELLTSDPDAAVEFYAAVVGWTTSRSTHPGMDYRHFRAGSTEVAGLMKLPAEAAASGVPPVWVGYIGVDDVDAAVASIVAKGGTVHMPAMDLPGVGRFAMLADPQGASFYVMRGASNEPSRAFSPLEPGHGAWHELHAKDGEAAFAFYAEQFQWRQLDALDMGPMGKYRLFGGSSDDAMGGMMTSPNFPHPMWLYYFTVEDIDAAQQRITKHGGTLLHGPVQVPGGGFIIQARDPQGAMFAVTGSRKA